MNVQSSDVQEAKNKANGKWQGVKDAIKEDGKTAGQVLATAAVSQKVLGLVQDHAGDLLKAGGQIAKSVNGRVMKFVKTYPVYSAVAGVAIAMFIGARLARQKIS